MPPAAQELVQRPLKSSLDSDPMISYMSFQQGGKMHTIKIFVKGGVVVDVDNLPDGFDYEIVDEDAEESATEWLAKGGSKDDRVQ